MCILSLYTQECFQKYPEVYSKYTEDDEEEEEIISIDVEDNKSTNNNN